MNLENDNSMSSFRIMRFLMGFLFALALFLVELGVSYILLNNDTRCWEIAQSSRVWMDPESTCLPEVVRIFLLALSKGPFTLVQSEVNSSIAWAVTGAIYAILGGFLAQFPSRFAVSVYLVIHALALIVITVASYLFLYIA
jgi:hypothetical protein